MTRNTNEPTVPEDHATFEHPILGQEAICPDGLGRVANFVDRYPERWIGIRLHTASDYKRWDPANVTLVPLPGGTNASLVRQFSELKKENTRLTRKVEHLSKGQCLHCVDAECDECDGTDSDDDEPKVRWDLQWDFETYQQELEQLTHEERLRWFRRHAWVAFAAAQLPNMEPVSAAEEADALLIQLEQRLDDETL